MKVFVAASLIILVSSAQQCTEKYVCNEDSKDVKCHSRSDAEGVTTIKVKKCSTGTCDKALTGLCITPLKLDGEKCSAPEECYSGNCKDSVCVGKDENVSCAQTEECKKDLYCSFDLNKVCKKYKKEGEPCSVGNECDFGLDCGSSTYQEAKKCVKMYSLKNGDYSDNKNLCETGYFYGTLADSKCSSTSNVEKEGEVCEADTDCKIKIKTGETEVEGNGKCTCSKIDLKSYCEYTTTNTKFQDYLTKAKSYFQGTSKSSDNIAVAKGETTEIKKASYAAKIEYKDAPSCLIEYLTSSSWIQFTFMALISVLLF